MARGVLTIERQCCDAVASVLSEYGALEGVQILKHNDSTELAGSVVVRVRPNMAQSSELDPHGGTLWEWSALLTVETTTVEDEQGQEALDVLARVRDCVYASTFIASLNAELDGLAVRAAQLLASDPTEDVEDNLNTHGVELRLKLQTTC